MKCDRCNNPADQMFRMMPLCGECKDHVKETRKKRKEKAALRLKS